MLKLFFWLLLIANGVLLAIEGGLLGSNPAERHEPQRLQQQLQPQTLTILPPNSAKLVQPVTAEQASATPQLDNVPASDGKTAIAAASPSSTTATAPVALPKPAITTSPGTAGAAAARSADKPEPKPEPKPASIACLEIGNFNTAEARRFESQLDDLSLSVKPTRSSVQDVASHMVYVPSQGSKEAAERKAAELRRLGVEDFYVIPESQPNPALHWAISLGVFKTEDAARAYVSQLSGMGVRSARVLVRTSGASKQVYQWRNIDPAIKTTLEALKAKFPGQDLRNCGG